MSGPYRMY